MPLHCFFRFNILRYAGCVDFNYKNNKAILLTLCKRRKKKCFNMFLDWYAFQLYAIYALECCIGIYFDTFTIVSSNNVC